MAVGKRRELLESYIGGLVHVHTLHSNFPIHFESNMTESWLTKTLIGEKLAGEPDSPLGFIAFTEHVSNPARPERLKLHSDRLRALLAQRQPAFVHGVPVLHGHEVSILPTGEVDMPTKLAERSAIVIASRHRLPQPGESDPAQIAALLIRASANHRVNILGHPMRNVEQVERVEWPHIFQAAAKNRTAVEINLNIFPDKSSQPARFAYWESWLADLAHSDAMVTIGVDLHNQAQVKAFVANWHQGETRGTGAIATSLNAIREAGISTERVVSARLERFVNWIHIDKDTINPVSSE